MEIKSDKKVELLDCDKDERLIAELAVTLYVGHCGDEKECAVQAVRFIRLAKEENHHIRVAYAKQTKEEWEVEQKQSKKGQ